MPESIPFKPFSAPGDWDAPCSWTGPSICICREGGLHCSQAEKAPLDLATGTFALLADAPQAVRLQEGSGVAWKISEPTAGTNFETRARPLPTWALHPVDRLLESHRLSADPTTVLLAYLSQELLLAPVNPPSTSWIDDLDDYLMDHLDENLSIDDLAARFGTSRSAFLRRYQRERSCSPITTLNQLRMKRAKELLQQPQPTISQVGHAVGFDQLSSFSHFFKRHAGLSPRQYRQQSEWLL